MKKTIEEFYNNCRDVLRGERNSQNNADQVSFDKSFKESIKYVAKHKNAIAYDLACDWEEHKFRSKQAEMEQTAANRSQRAERLIELGKSYKPAAAPLPAKAEPAKSAEQQPPDSGGKMMKSNWGNLFAIYGDKPFMVREGEPYKNLFSDDPDRSYRSGKDFDMDRE